MFEWLFLLFSAPAAAGTANAQAPAKDYVAVVAAEAAYATLLPSTPDKTIPQPGDICPNCNGVGKVGDGIVMNTCKPCKGTGRVLPVTTLPLREMPPAPALFRAAPVQSVPATTLPANCPDGKCPPGKLGN